MDMTQTDSPDQSMGDVAQPSADAGYVIEITVSPDGTFEVDSEPLEEEAQEEAGEAPGSEMSASPIKSFGEALKRALEIYQNNGDDGDSDEQFDAGFSGENEDSDMIDITKKPDMSKVRQL